MPFASTESVKKKKKKKGVKKLLRVLKKASPYQADSYETERRRLGVIR